MYWSKTLKRLRFDDQTTFNHDVGSTGVSNRDPIKEDWNRPLSLNSQPSLQKTSGEHCFINRFEQTRTKSLVNLKAAIDCFTSEFFDLGHLRAFV